MRFRGRVRALLGVVLLSLCLGTAAAGVLVIVVGDLWRGLAMTGLGGLAAWLTLPSVGRRYVRYRHHGRLVWVRSDLRGDHADFCLCCACKRFRPGECDNCHIAESTYENCCEHDLVTPVWECPKFIEDVD